MVIADNENFEPETVEEFHPIRVDEGGNHLNEVDVIVLENKPVEMAMTVGEVDVAQHELSVENRIEMPYTEAETAEVNLMGKTDTSECNAKEKGADELTTIEGKEALDFQSDKEEHVTMEAVDNREAVLMNQLDNEAAPVCELPVKGNNMVEYAANKGRGEVEGLVVELPLAVVALTGCEKEGTKDDDANISLEADVALKENVKKSRKRVRKKKTVKEKPVVADGESKPQLPDLHGPVVKRVNENEENPDNVNNLRRVRKRMKRMRKGKRVQRKVEKGDADELSVKDKDLAEPSKGNRSSKTEKTMGVIFMCNSKTKKDCFHHKIFGLPASKKDMVCSISEGTRLFLFDFESRLLYGIYKAAGPGGYNIEPNAFNSNFPSQVRFTVVNECSPLPEGKFKEAIKDNYYAKNKFNAQLNPDQVKELCKLFVANGTKGTKSASKTSRGGKKRRRDEDYADQGWKRNITHKYANREITRQRAKNVVFEREAYVPRALPALSYATLPPPAPSAYQIAYNYGRTLGTDQYGQERALGLQDPRLAYSRLNYVDQGRSDPYPNTSYSSYIEPVVDRYPQYHTSARQDYYSSTLPEEVYRPSSSRTSYHQVPLPPYRRY